MREPRGGRWSTRGIVLFLPLLCVLCALSFGGCDYTATITQGSGLPALRHLNWGVAFFQDALWSPDGRYIAGLAGDDYASSHLQVITPDGRTRYDLKNWGCGEAESFDFAWLPDGQLSCIRADPSDPPNRMCIGAAAFTSCERTIISDSILATTMAGAVWAPDSSYLIVAAHTSDPNNTVTLHPWLQVVSRAGQVTQTISFDASGGFWLPTWVPGQSGRLTYLIGNNLDISTVSRDVQGMLALSSPSSPLATVEFAGTDSRYAWAPSGRWVATRQVSSNQGSDKIYLVNAHNPSQTVDVVLSDQIGQQMIDPLWSPDGKTLIVFTVGVGVSQPYAIDIASYLHSKGLQP